MELAKDDWELTLKELKNQRVQQMISLAIVEAGIKHVENELEGYEDGPKK